MYKFAFDIDITNLSKFFIYLEGCISASMSRYVTGRVI